jgi:hypothetical protein
MIAALRMCKDIHPFAVPLEHTTVGGSCAPDAALRFALEYKRAGSSDCANTVLALLSIEPSVFAIYQPVIAPPEYTRPEVTPIQSGFLPWYGGFVGTVGVCLFVPIISLCQ